MNKIVTEHIFPSIPTRGMDWCAWYEDDEETGPCGYGRTEQAAIDDLLESFPNDESK